MGLLATIQEGIRHLLVIVQKEVVRQILAENYRRSGLGTCKAVPHLNTRMTGGGYADDSPMIKNHHILTGALIQN